MSATAAVDPRAVVSESARLGAGVRVGAYAVVTGTTAVPFPA